MASQLNHPVALYRVPALEVYPRGTQRVLNGYSQGTQRSPTGTKRVLNGYAKGTQRVLGRHSRVLTWQHAAGDDVTDAWLAAQGVARVVAGHKPCGDSPFVVLAGNLESAATAANKTWRVPKEYPCSGRVYLRKYL